MQEISAKELKEIELNMLKEVDLICRKHGITYYAIGGTLLGAIRHNGFIPWDDDIDIAMFENDYNKFREVIEIESENLRFDCLENSTDYPYAYGKVCRIDTLIKERYLKGYNKAGVFIDVFRIDNRGKKEQAIKLYIKLNNLQTYWLSTFSLNSELTDNPIKKWYRTIREIWRKRKTTRKWAECIDSLSKSPLLNQKEYCSWIHEKPFPYEIFNDTVDVEFEDMVVACPIGWDMFLKIKYGDYMLLPPIDQRKTNHSFDAYKIKG